MNPPWPSTILGIRVRTLHNRLGQLGKGESQQRHGLERYTRLQPRSRERGNAVKAACTVHDTSFFRFSATQFSRICGFRV